jgi:ubiquinol-cytochrome c reductase cytochrome b subunit
LFLSLFKSLATVITSLASALPLIGHAVVAWLWGGFAVDNPTLNRFYSAHYLLPFILAALSLLHLAALHQYGSTNPLGVNAQIDLVDFYPYYTSKDIVGLLIVSVFAVFLVFFYPDILSHPDNNIPANPYSTPAHIQPEWYFLWVYAILRSIPNKRAGVAAVGLVFLSLGLLPYLHKHPVRSAQFRLLQTWLYWTFRADCARLTWIGIMPVEAPYLLMGQLASVWFFLYLLVFLPRSAWLEQKLATHLEKTSVERIEI